MVTKHFKLIIIFIFLITFIFTSSIFGKSKFNLQNHIDGMFRGEDLDPKYGKYEEISIPEKIYDGPIDHVDLKRKSVQKVLFRFVQRKSSLSRYPSKAIEGIIWLEVMYNEMIRYPKSVQPETIREIWKAIRDIRKSMGFPEDISTQDAIENYFVLSLLLEDAKVEKQKIDKSLKKRKEILQDLKSDILKAKNKYLNSMDDYQLTKFNENNPLFKIDNNTKEIPKKEKETLVIEPNITITTDLESKLLQLKDFYDKGLITEEEYKIKKQELLDEF